jgi:spoIIIJ-associated protein
LIDKYTAQASTKDQAIEKGLKALGITKDEAIIEVTKEGKKGFLGFGQQDAVVTVKRKKTSTIMEEVFTEKRLGKELVRPEADISEKTSNAKEEEEPSIKEKNEKIEDSKNVQEASSFLTDQKNESNEEEFESKSVGINQEDADQEGIESVKEYLHSIVEKMGVDDVTITVQREGQRVQFNVETEDAGLIIGRHGKVLNGLQTLAQIQLHQLADSKLFAKVDAENYRDRRKKTVEQLARRTADKVKQTNRPVILEPMPAHERKQIHRYLNTYPEVQTHSEGKEPHRYLVVEPAE